MTKPSVNGITSNPAAISSRSFDSTIVVSLSKNLLYDSWLNLMISTINSLIVWFFQLEMFEWVDNAVDRMLM